MKPLNVLLFGASRSGKTSMLASMLEQSKDILRECGLDFDEEFTATEKVKESQILHVVSEMKDFLKLQEGSCRLGALTGSQDVYKYVFKLEPYNASANPLSINFYDVPGEKFTGKNKESLSYIKAIARESQILLVAVDVPALMYAEASNSDVYDQEVNLNDRLQQLISYLGATVPTTCNGGPSAKLIVFVPVKCEAWIHSSDYSMNDVYDKIRSVYATAIANAQSLPCPKRIVITPIETIGNLLYSHHSSPSNSKVIFFDESNYKRLKKEYENKGFSSFKSEITEEALENVDGIQYGFRCEGDGDEVVLSNSIRYTPCGKERIFNMLDIYNQRYPFCYCENYMIPYTWYKVIGKEYQPKNCNQLLFEVIKFTIQNFFYSSGLKYKNAKMDRKSNESSISIWDIVIPFRSIWKVIKIWIEQNATVDVNQTELLAKAMGKMTAHNGVTIELYNSIDGKEGVIPELES